MCCNSSAREDIWLKIVLARIYSQTSSLRERPIMSKDSREATESTEGATLRMGAAERPWDPIPSKPHPQRRRRLE